MNLKEQITKDMTEAMKNKDKLTLSVLRLLKSALQLESIKEKKELEDKDVIVVIKRSVKQRKDSISEFLKFNKQEEVQVLEEEILVLKKYLPQELSDEQIDSKIDEIFEELKPQSIKDMGLVMKRLTEDIGAVADMSKVSQKVKEKF